GQQLARGVRQFGALDNVVRRYLLDSFSARLKRFSISASPKGENSFSFSPVAGFIDAIGITLIKGSKTQHSTFRELCFYKRKPFGIRTRSSKSKHHCTSSASTAAGIAPSRMVT